MTVLVTPEEMRAVEAEAIAEGRPEPQLMRAAASGIAAWVNRHISRSRKGQRVAIALVGPGNNGGDALVTLAFLVEFGWRCRAVYVGRSELGQLPAAESSLGAIERVTEDSLSDADIVLDGVYGIASRATLPGDIASLFRQAHAERVRRGTPQVAIDVPSGIDAGSGAAAPDAFRADVTLCLGLPKIGLIREPAASHVGELELIDIGVPTPPASGRPQLVTEDMVRAAVPRREASAHKYAAGTVVVVGGAPTYYGAPRLSAEAALRAGAGLVCAAIPRAIVPAVAAQVPELVFLPLDDQKGQHAASQIAGWVADRSGRVHSMIIGPGLGRDERVIELLDHLLGRAESLQARQFSLIGGLDTGVPTKRQIAFVIDADALHWLASKPRQPLGIPLRSAVLTPHAGEMARLMNVAIDDVLRDPLDAARQAAKTFNQTVVLKSGFSAIATPDGDVRVAPRAAPELATAGTGDVLAGLIGGLLAQGSEPIDAATAALYVGARAGHQARDDLGTLSVTATDLIDRIPGAFRQLTEPSWQD